MPDKWQDIEIATHDLSHRVSGIPRGIIPQAAKYLTAAIDLGKYLNHWIVVAWTADPYAYVIDFGRIEVASEDLGVEQATVVALRQSASLAKGFISIG